MCGIFGLFSSQSIDIKDLSQLALHARQRGRDSSGIVYYDKQSYVVKKADNDITKLLRNNRKLITSTVLGHSRLITDGLSDNQPVVRDNICVLHNGIVVNNDELWNQVQNNRLFEIDSEIIAVIALNFFSEGGLVENLPEKILSLCKGTVACALVLPELGKVLLFSNNGSLYLGKKEDTICFSSEKYPLETMKCQNIEQIWEKGFLIDIPLSNRVDIDEICNRSENLIPAFKNIKGEEDMLEYIQPDLKRCTKCILPETMPFIHFDSHGVCNYCNNYQPRNIPKPKEELFELVHPYRKEGKPDCIVPFSGGRDSCYGLHLIVNELQMNPITYTYDWGMVTDLGRRNISRMCADLGVENIIVAADISKKRRNISLNLKAWLKAPHLGMISILTAGDKHFFRHVETVKKQTGIDLNLWGVNPLEVTHFKAGFLGVKPDFEETRVYRSGFSKQLSYQWLRFKAMTQSIGYFNHSLWDTITGEYYRSFTKKSDYYHIFDYWRWDEKETDETLAGYDWELAPDTNTTWRIGDGTAAFYNYLYYTVAGFTEHDTFRSNQIREGQLTREEALAMVREDNRPRYQNIRWYLDALGLNFKDVIEAVNKIPRLYEI